MPASSPGHGALKALLILHKAMLSSQLIFLAVFFYLVYTVSISMVLNYPDKILQVAAIAFSAGGIYIGSVLFKRKLLAAREMSTGLKEKVLLYRNACITRWAILEAVVLFVLVCFLLTGNYAFMALAAVMMIGFAGLAPSKIKMGTQLGLSEKEIAKPE